MTADTSTLTPDAPQNDGVANADNAIQWCLLSHTNIGKTTLARTLLADDIGEVQDAAHVTSQSQRYRLQRTPQGDELWLWDTPGFGDSLRLYNRLNQQGNPLGWFLSNVWDRWRDKPFYMSQRALLAARDHADVMLYLVNAAEDPADAGYWASEMRILQWMNKPVMVLLNQIGSDTTAQQTAADLQRWRNATAEFAGTVNSVQILDAFTRSWWHEKQVMQSIAPLLPAAKQASYQRLLQERATAQQNREAASLQALATQLAPQQGWLGASVQIELATQLAAADDELARVELPYTTVVRYRRTQVERRGSRQRDAHGVTNRGERRSSQVKVALEPRRTQ